MLSEHSKLLESACVILYHKQSTSAMTRFFRLEDGPVVMGAPLPKLSRVVTGEVELDSAVVLHPASVAAEMERWFGVESGALEVDSDYQELIEVPGGTLRVYLARFKTVDPPFAAAEKAGGSFITLTQTRGMNPVELELLRTAYTSIMEG